MENLSSFTLFGRYTSFIIMMISLLIILIVSDIIENGVLAFVTGLITIGFNYFWGTFPILTFITLRNVLMYVFIGFVFSLIRTYFKGKELDKQEKEYYDLKLNVFRWWLMFPICFITWMFRRLLNDLFNLIFSLLKKLYLSLFNIN